MNRTVNRVSHGEVNADNVLREKIVYLNIISGKIIKNGFLHAYSSLHSYPACNFSTF